MLMYSKTTSRGYFTLSITVIAETILEMGKTVGRENKTVLFSVSMSWSTGIVVSQQHCENTFRCPFEHFLNTLIFNYVMEDTAGEFTGHQVLI